MASSVAFNDGAAAVLANGRPVPFDRFWLWTPGRVDIKAEQVIVGTGDTEAFVFRTDHVVDVEMRDIPESMHAIALRCIQHFTRGGQGTLNAGDPAANVYTVKLRPKTVPTLAIQDENKPTYVFRIAFKNVAAADLLCVYGG